MKVSGSEIPWPSAMASPIPKLGRYSQHAVGSLVPRLPLSARTIYAYDLWPREKRSGSQRRSNMRRDCIIVNEFYADTAISFLQLSVCGFKRILHLCCKHRSSMSLQVVHSSTRYLEFWYDPVTVSDLLWVGAQRRRSDTVTWIIQEFQVTRKSVCKHLLKCNEHPEVLCLPVLVQK